MINLAAGTKVFLACRPVDLRNGFDGLAVKAQQIIGADPFSGHLFIFRGKRGDYFKGLYWDGSGMWLIASTWFHTRIPFPLAEIILARWRVGAQQPGRRGGSIGYIV